MFLRITFAAWYELPLQLEAHRRAASASTSVTTACARRPVGTPNSPEFAIAYKDYTSMTTPTGDAPGPRTRRSRKRKLWGGEDEQPELGAGAVFGAYLDEIHLNKRAGYFTVIALNYLGSANLADTANTYNLVPEAVRAGDMLIERWQQQRHRPHARRQGGHAARRRQPRRHDDLAARCRAARACKQSRPVVEELLHERVHRRRGRQLRRRRATRSSAAASSAGASTKNVGGYWTNTWMAGRRGAAGSTRTDYAAHRGAARALRGAARPGLAAAAEAPSCSRRSPIARHHLAQYPASCSRARAPRARVRASCTTIAGELGTTQARSTRSTATARGLRARRARVHEEQDVLLELARRRDVRHRHEETPPRQRPMRARLRAARRVQVAQPTATSAGRTYAASLGRAAEWKAWSEDEACPQRNVAVGCDRAERRDGVVLAVATTRGGATCRRESRRRDLAIEAELAVAGVGAEVVAPALAHAQSDAVAAILAIGAEGAASAVLAVGLPGGDRARVGRERRRRHDHDRARRQRRRHGRARVGRRVTRRRARLQRQWRVDDRRRRRILHRRRRLGRRRAAGDQDDEQDIQRSWLPIPPVLHHNRGGQACAGMDHIAGLRRPRRPRVR